MKRELVKLEIEVEIWHDTPEQREAAINKHCDFSRGYSACRSVRVKPTQQHYVYGPSFGAPRFIHMDENSARIEAERLAKERPGNSFEVLAIVAKCSIERPELKWSDNWEQEVPF